VTHTDAVAAGVRIDIRLSRGELGATVAEVRPAEEDPAGAE
jgi:hypothetical protein